MGQQLEYLVLSIMNGSLLYVLGKLIRFIVSKKDRR